MTSYIDIGANLTARSFRDDLDRVIQRAADAGVNQMIVTGTNIEHSLAALELCRLYPQCLYATAGVHPHHADEFTAETARQLADISQDDAVLAIGECGLDFNRNYSSPQAQRYAFEAQLELATETRLPVFLHQRDAHKEFISMISSCRAELGRAVAHCFTGTVEQVIDLLALDMYIGVTGWICDERRGEALRQAVKHIPLDRLMLETDAPYLLPRDLAEKPMMSRRNEPCYLPHIARAVAVAMGVERNTLCNAVLDNTKLFFGIQAE